MKKIFVLCVAVMLAFPAMSYAGSATSRWDLTIGGMVKLDYFYADQSSNQDITNAERQAANNNSSSRDRYGSTSWGVGESRLNFLVKGPDTWGAKTSAFIEFDFRSMTSNGVAASSRNSVEDYGLANLRHAFMKFDWPTFSIVAGQTWSVPGNQPCFCLLGVNENGSFNKGILVPQVYGVWQATKTFSITGGIQSPYSWNSWPGGSLASGPTIDDGFQRSNLPLFFSEILYKTDACGKIGPWMLQFGLGGIWGQERPISPPAYGPAGDINSGNTFIASTASGSVSAITNTAFFGSGPGNSVQYWSNNGYDSNTVNMWMMTFKSFIPIIPEKAPGKLAHSLGLAISAFTGQDNRLFAGAPPFKLATYAYDRTAFQFRQTATGATFNGTTNTTAVNYAAYNGQLQPNANFVAPVNTGGWAQLQWYWTDTLWSGFYYGQSRVSLSNARKNNIPFLQNNNTLSTLGAISPGAIERQQEYHVNLVYDPNPAIRLGLEYSWYQSHYARNLYNQNGIVNGIPSGLTSDGNVNTVRFSAQYFF